MLLLSVKGVGQDIFGIVTPQSLTYKGNGNVPTVGITLGCYVDLVTNYTSTDGAGYSSTSAPKNVGSYHLSLSFVPLSACSGTGDIDFAITQKSLTMTGLSVPSSKIYDGTVSATVNDLKALLGAQAAGAGSTSDGKPYSVDAVSLTGTAAGAYNTKDVATATIVTYTGITLTGTGNGNYTLTTQTSAATITQKSLTVAGSTTTNKQYDRTNTASVTGGTLVGIISPDVVNLTQSGTFVQANVGTGIAITSTSTIDNANYSLTQPALTSRDITAKPLTVTGSITTNKQYDRTNTASVTGGTLVGIISPDVVNLTQSGTFVQSNVGTGIAITSTSTIDNTNYSLTQPALAARDITVKPLTITAVDKTKVYGAILPILAVAYNGLVIGDVAPTATISTIALASSPVGTYSITATGAVDPNYTISYVAGKLTVTKAILTITAVDKIKIYGAALPALTVTYSGLVNGDVAPTTLPTISTTALASSPVDSYPITVSPVADANYTINYVPGILIINKVPLIITADNNTRVYGAIDPIFTYTYSGLVNGDVAPATLPSISTTALASSPAGSYPIIPSTATDPNYTITYVNGSLTVTKAALTIKAKPHTITYNGTAYAGGNGVIPTGFARGESIGNLNGTLTYGGTSQGAKNAGTYTIIPDGLSSPNYNISYVGDNLEIKKVTLNVTAGNQSVEYGTQLAKILSDAQSNYSGFVGGDDATVISGAVSYLTNYTSSVSAGTTGIFLEPKITGLSTTNYELIAEKGNITITAPPASPVFQIPNAFTPNFDGHNDVFKIVENGYVKTLTSFRVYTKSGKMIFNKIDEGWDGRYAGIMLDADVYIWIADFINKNNIQEHLSGTVLLLK